jgi:hypothetical protein
MYSCAIAEEFHGGGEALDALGLSGEEEEEQEESQMLVELIKQFRPLSADGQWLSFQFSSSHT